MPTLSPDHIALLSFANLLDVANLCASGGQAYELQAQLATVCREAKRPFLATMPVRNRFKCPVCGVEQTQAELHFEDPRQPISGPATEWMWSKPIGRFVDIDLSKLHGILVHGDAPPDEFALLFANVGS